jgi:hypothetical protein
MITTIIIVLARATKSIHPGKAAEQIDFLRIRYKIDSFLSILVAPATSKITVFQAYSLNARARNYLETWITLRKKSLKSFSIFSLSHGHD